MFAPEVLNPVAHRLAELAGSGRALDLAIGTGRVAIPLRERGLDVAVAEAVHRELLAMCRAYLRDTSCGPGGSGPDDDASQV